MIKGLFGRSTLACLSLAACAASASAQVPTERVLPSTADPRVRDFDYPNVILNGTLRDAPLVVFMPGTGGGKNGGPGLLLQTVAAQGYRVIFLTYNNEPAAVQTCPSRPPQCYGNFREERVFGDANGPVSNPTAEAIVPRLSALLRYLDRQHPDAGWGGYLTPRGTPEWPRIVVSGLSQGAGMAAYIAKRFPVRRVVLFSSPWDDVGPQKRPAPWLFSPSATPPNRWWAERHARENTTRLIAQAYDVLQIPQQHILLFNGGLPAGASGENPYHGSTVALPAYRDQWRVLFGTSDADRR